MRSNYLVSIAKGGNTKLVAAFQRGQYDTSWVFQRRGMSLNPADRSENSIICRPTQPSCEGEQRLDCGSGGVAASTKSLCSRNPGGETNR
jgi:hypothetical protein